MRAGALKVVFALIGIFLAGGVAGWFSGAAWSREYQERISAKEFAERQLNRRIKDLELTPQQVEQIRPIQLELEEQLRGCRRRSVAEVTEVLRTMNARLEKQLTPDQIDRFREIVAKELEKFEKEMQRRSRRSDVVPAPSDSSHNNSGGSSSKPSSSSKPESSAQPAPTSAPTAPSSTPDSSAH